MRELVRTLVWVFSHNPIFQPLDIVDVEIDISLHVWALVGMYGGNIDVSKSDVFPQKHVQ